MTRYIGEPDFVHGTPAGTGVLLTNLGTPTAPTARALRRYLAEFLSDPRVVELPRVLWWPLLYGVILWTRPRRAAANYAKIWTDTGSPLRAISVRQVAAVQAKLDTQCRGPVAVALGMRYGEPSLAAGLERLRRAHARRILIVPLYPQYSAATTASTFDAVARVLKRWRWLPELRFVNHYHDAPGYVQALAARIRKFWNSHGQAARLLFSFHGLPRRNVLAGDPYFCECHKTARLVAEALQLPEARWQVAFQSRFGRARWLEPYTIELLRDWGGGGVKNVDVVCPGFAADCLETLEEIAQLNRDAFLRAGGERFQYIPALNDCPEHIEFLADLVLRHTAGWPETADAGDDEPAHTAAEASRQRALARGAPR